MSGSIYDTGAMTLPETDRSRQQIAPSPANPYTPETPGGRSIMDTSYKQVPSDTRAGSVWDTALHGLGLGTREVVEGLTSLPTAALDVATYPGRLINRALGIQTTAPSDLVKSGLDWTGLPNPTTPEDQQRAEAIRGASAMLGPIGIGAVPALASRVPAVLGPLVATPATQSLPAAVSQVAAGGVGGVAGEKLAESEYVPEWLKPTARLVGNIAGAGGTAALQTAGGTLVNAVRGIPGEIAAAAERLGITPKSTAAVTTSPALRQTEGILTDLPGGNVALQPAHQETVDQFGNAVQRTANKFGPELTADEAGTTAQKALRDWRTNTFPAEQDAAWTPLNTRLAGTSVDPAPYRTALERAANDPALASMPANQRAFAIAKAKEWLGALNEDVPPGQQMSWEQAQAIRRKIGDAMGTPEISGSIGDAALKNIYGSLAGAMEKTAVTNGQAGPFAAANQVTIDGHNFIDTVLTRAVSKNNAGQETIAPDAAARSLLGSNDALQQLRARVPEAADALAAHQLRQNALARPSQQTDGGAVSTGTFLTNTAAQRMARPGGTAALFGPQQQDIADLVTFASNLRKMEQTMNAPKTAGAAAIAILAPQLLAAWHSGGTMGMAQVLAANLGAPYVAGRFLTNPGLIRLAGAQRGQNPFGGPRVAGLLGGLEANTASQPQDQR